MGTWTKKKFKDICSKVDYGFTANATHDGVGPKFLRITDIVPSIIDWGNVPFCKISETDEYKYILADGDIVVARTGATTGYAKCLKNPPKAVFASYLVRFRVDESNDKRFVGHVIQSDLYKKFVTKNLGGSAQPQANAQILGSYELSLPAREDQIRIASILSTYDDLIENNEKRIKALEEMAQLLYTEWFVKFKFPGHEKAKMVDSGAEYGMVPEGWGISRLDRIAQINAETFKKTDDSEVINYIDIASVSTGRIDFIQSMPFSEAPSRARRLVRHGDILWSTVRPNRKSYSLVINPIHNLVASTGFALIRSIKIPYTYLYHALTTEDFVGYLVNHAQGAAYPAVKGEDFEKAMILLPTTVLLDKFHNLTLGLYNQKDSLRRKNIHLQEMRDLLIPQLVTGKRILK